MYMGEDSFVGPDPPHEKGEVKIALLGRWEPEQHQGLILCFKLPTECDSRYEWKVLMFLSDMRRFVSLVSSTEILQPLCCGDNNKTPTAVLSTGHLTSCQRMYNGYSYHLKSTASEGWDSALWANPSIQNQKLNTSYNILEIKNFVVEYIYKSLYFQAV